MVEYKENGEPIPDGRLIVEVSRELAEFWDGSDNPRQSECFYFKDIRSHAEESYGIRIRFPIDEGERANTMIIIPWQHVLSLEICMNSPECAAALREWNASQVDQAAYNGR